MSLNPGEKYLTIKLDLGVLGSHEVVVFPNKDVNKKSNAPDFKGKNVAVWVNTKKYFKETETEDIQE